MLRLECPHCGPRDVEEFHYGGDGSVRRPDDDGSAFTEPWMDYVYRRDNPDGPHVECWYHAGGCRRWFRVTRDTRDDRVLAPGDGNGREPGAP